ncbi:SLBB domain-containing protein [Candidatus Fermentibacterales bacterium]|nr:SLBB domain-containing protein [Candidatus Fermentibacterales bacterium]
MRLIHALLAASAGLVLASGLQGYQFPGQSGEEIMISVHVWGEVRTPGTHLLPIGSDLIAAISEAGGPTADADLDDVRLFQGVGDPPVRIEYDLESFLEGRGPVPPMLSPGATVFVSRSTSDWWKEALDVAYKLLVTANLVWIMLER